MPKPLDAIKALACDVFGTVVDWHGSIVREAAAFGATLGLTVDWSRFVDAWMAGNRQHIEQVRQRALPWTTLDAIHRLVLADVLKQFGITGLSTAETDHLHRVWHRLTPWPDAVEGLTRLRQRFILAALSNGNMALLTNMAKYAGLPWDCILSAELAQQYKPHPAVYQTAVELLGLEPEEVMMVAAHAWDLHAAQAVGCRTALVYRPQVSGPVHAAQATPPLLFDVCANDLNDLADKLAG